MPAERAELSCPQLQDCRRQLADCTTRMEALVEGLSDAQVNWRTAAGKWSVAENLAHLNATTELYLPALDRTIDRGRARGVTGAGPFRYGGMVKWFTGALEPPPRRAFKAPGKFQPPPHEQLPLAAVTAEFRRLQDELDGRLVASDGLHLAKLKLRSPAAPLLRLRLGGAFEILAAHQRRHLWQAEQVRQAEGFPGA